MFSVVIRNKNEAVYLEKVLYNLNTFYKDDVDDIVIVDNNSVDNSLVLAKRYGCTILTISDFSYGRAINMGIQAARNKYILLLSSHTIPIGENFFKSSLSALNSKIDIAGLRFINSFKNYERAIANDFLVKEPLKYGLMAACCVVLKDVWVKHKFNEELSFSEDKEWSHRVSNKGFKIYDINETFFYFIKRNKRSEIIRFKNESLAYYQLQNIKPPNKLKVTLSFIKKIFIKRPKMIIGQIVSDFRRAKVQFLINSELKKMNDN